MARKPDKCFLSATVTQSRRLVGLEFSWPHLLHVSLGLRLRQSCAGNRIAPMQHEQLGLGTVLARPQARDGVGPAVELPGLRHVVDAHDEGQAACKERVSKARLWPCPLVRSSS